MRGVDDIGGVGGERQQHQAVRPERTGKQRAEVSRVQGKHQHAEHVLPEEGRGEQVAAEDDLFPDRAGDHDCVERQGLDHHGADGERQAVAGRQKGDDQTEARKEDHELNRREDPLDKRPACRIAAQALLGRVKAGAHRRRRHSISRMATVSLN